jgi:hypothetical protein
MACNMLFNRIEKKTENETGKEVRLCQEEMEPVRRVRAP